MNHIELSWDTNYKINYKQTSWFVRIMRRPNDESEFKTDDSTNDLSTRVIYFSIDIDLSFEIIWKIEFYLVEK